jgi:hypothetical protein
VEWWSVVDLQHKFHPDRQLDLLLRGESCQPWSLTVGAHTQNSPDRPLDLLFTGGTVVRCRDENLRNHHREMTWATTSTRE